MKLCFRLLDVIAFCSVVWLSGFCLFNKHINSYTLDYETKTDAIITLTGGRNRIAESITLLNKNLADKLFISGVPHNIKIKDIEKEAQTTADFEDRIVLGRKATNTIENASETTEWIKENHIKSIRLVTSYYHIPRSMQEFLANDKNIKIIIHPVYSPNVAKEWWKKWGTFKLIAVEYTKFLL